MSIVRILVNREGRDCARLGLVLDRSRYIIPRKGEGSIVRGKDTFDVKYLMCNHTTGISQRVK